jgi:hypothetical protein
MIRSAAQRWPIFTATLLQPPQVHVGFNGAAIIERQTARLDLLLRCCCAGIAVRAYG